VLEEHFVTFSSCLIVKVITSNAIVDWCGTRSLRNEPQHHHVSAITKTKMHVPLIGFSHSQNNVPFAITNVAVRKLTSNLHQPHLRALFA
jgi:hypothetical protein